MRFQVDYHNHIGNFLLCFHRSPKNTVKKNKNTGTKQEYRSALTKQKYESAKQKYRSPKQE